MLVIYRFGKTTKCLNNKVKTYLSKQSECASILTPQYLQLYKNYIKFVKGLSLKLIIEIYKLLL